MSDGPQFPNLPPLPVDWAEFVNAVHRADRFRQLNTEWRPNNLPPRNPPTGPPTFEFMGWRVYKPQ